jgi:hypothetical protein
MSAMSKRPYELIRSTLRNGDLILCSGNYIVSKLIQKTTSSEFSHVSFVARWQNRVMVFEAVEPDGIRVVPLSHYLTDYENKGKPYKGTIYLARLKQPNPIPSLVFNGILSTAINLLNADYDVKDIVRIFFRITMKMPLYYEMDKSYICSEYVERCFSSGFGEPAFFTADPASYVSPDTIAKSPKVSMVCQII